MHFTHKETQAGTSDNMLIKSVYSIYYISTQNEIQIVLTHVEAMHILLCTGHDMCPYLNAHRGKIIVLKSITNPLHGSIATNTTICI